MSALPISYTKIEDNLFLGNFATAIDEPTLRQLGISKILTLREFGITDDKKVADVEYRHIAVNDTINDDLLTHFPICHRYIEEGQNNGQTVLVHCRLGVSRSATIIISYIMSKYSIHWDEAIQRVQKKRKEVKPNPSFLYQLKLFDEMNFTFNGLHPGFRQFLLKRWIYVSKKKILSNALDTDSTILCNYFSILTLTPEEEGQPYCCSECKAILFREIHVIRDLSLQSPRYQCNYLMIEPQEWFVDQVIDTFSGSIRCLKCRTTVGEFNWQRSLCGCILHSKCKPYQVFRFATNFVIKPN